MLFDLIDALKQHETVNLSSSGDSHAPTWRVSFRGAPSYRHVNKIAIFRDFLDNLLHTQLTPVSAERGSVVINFAPIDSSNTYIADSINAIKESEPQITEVANFLGISGLEFQNNVMKF